MGLAKRCNGRGRFIRDEYESICCSGIFRFWYYVDYGMLRARALTAVREVLFELVSILLWTVDSVADV